MNEERLTEEIIRTLVDRFYGRVRQDELLAPIFDAATGDDWDAHLPRMYDFWSSVMLTSGRYKGDPLAVHRPLALTPIHFARWLMLFEETARDLFSDDVALAFIDRAHRIAHSLQRALRLPATTSTVAVPSAGPPGA